MKKILCLVLNFESEHYTNNCLDSLLYSKILDLFVIDNSIKQSYTLPRRFKKIVKIIRTGGNIGFAAANNFAVKNQLNKAHEAILFLNDDTIIEKGAIEVLSQTIKKKKYRCNWSMYALFGVSKKIWACGGEIKKLSIQIGGLQPKSNLPYEVDYLPAAAFICKSQVWNKVGGFNDKYFFGYEEAELSLEIKKIGFRILVDPRSVIFHHVGLSSQFSSKLIYNGLRNKFTFAKYLYGNKLGFFYCFFQTLISSLKYAIYEKSLLRTSLWIMCVLHEFKGIKISNSVLNKIEDDYKLIK